jgi:ectoine hydroxylase-related dioxygenase (phytanoyl-CoA dioxygenase family)
MLARRQVSICPSVELTDQQIRFYRENGYLSVPRVTEDEDLVALRAIYDDLFARRAGYEDGTYFDFTGNEKDGAIHFPQMFHPSWKHPGLLRSQLYTNCAHMARQLLGSKARFVFDHALMKPPGGSATPWHQDLAFASVGMRREIITFWVALDDVNRDNGCMEFIPRSHLGPLYPHGHPNDDPTIHAITAMGVDESTAVACPLRAGGATLHGNMMLHYTAPNLTQGHRRAYALMFGVKAERVLVESPYPWMQEKRTAQAERDWKSRGLFGKVKLVGKTGLEKIGIYVGRDK